MKKLYMLFIFAMLLLSIVPLTFAEEDECAVDTDCDDDEYCSESFECLDVSCTENTDCEEGYFCDDEGECEVICTSDADCEEEDYCTDAGECEEIEEVEIECAVDADCETGLVCNNSGECEELEDSDEDEEEIECTTNSECAEGEYCTEDGECEDLEDSDEVDDQEDIDDEDSKETGVELDDDDDDAEEDEELEIENEVKAFESNLGGKIRLATLEKKLSWAIARGEIIVDYQEEKYAGADLAYLDDLNSILDELSAIVIELQDLQEAGTDAEAYSDYRKDAWRLVREFKRIAWKNTSPADREEIKVLLKDADYSFLDDSRNKIKKWIREHNAEKARDILEDFGKNNPDFVERVRNGELSPSDIKNRLKDEYKALRGQLKEEAKQKLKEIREKAESHREKARDRFRAETESIREQRQDALKEQRKQRGQDLKEFRDNIRARVVGIGR